MKFLPLLLRPRYWALRNRWRHSPDVVKRIMQDIVVAGVMLILTGAMYSGTYRMLRKVQTLAQMAYLPVTHTLGMIFALLFAMLFISALVIAFHVIVTGRDLELILASSISRAKFFTGKYCQVLIGSCWMPLIFIAPVLIAFSQVYQGSTHVYAGALIILLPYFIIPTAAATTVIMIFAVTAPTNRSRELLIAAGALAILALISVVEIVDVDSSALKSTKSLLRILSMLSMPNVQWLPSTWVGRCFQQLLEPGSPSATLELVLLYATAGAFLCSSYIIIALGHSHAYTKIAGLRLRRKANSTLLGKRRFLNGPIAPYLAVMMKEIKSVFRDTGQAMQIVILFALGGLYLYNLQIIGANNLLPDGLKLDMRTFFYIINSAIGAFITTALCTRFVFPCIPLEGPAFWVIEKSPFSFKRLIFAKFVCWLLPVMFASWLVFSIGAFAIEPSVRVTSINLLTATCISVGIVGMGIGFGAYFGDFDWEHASQLHAGFGSLIYMLFAVLLICLSMVPTGIMLYSTDPLTGAKLLTPERQMFRVVLCSLWLIGTNYLACIWSLRLGENALRARN